MRHSLVLALLSCLLMVACGGDRGAPTAHQAWDDTEPGSVHAGRVVCQVGAIKWQQDGTLAVAFWNDWAADYRPGQELPLYTAEGGDIAVATVHRTSPERGAMSLRIDGDTLESDLVRGSVFHIPLP